MVSRLKNKIFCNRLGPDIFDGMAAKRLKIPPVEQLDAFFRILVQQSLDIGGLNQIVVGAARNEHRNVSVGLQTVNDEASKKTRAPGDHYALIRKGHSQLF